ncbi:MAG TPA: NAD(P)/FAD-dependent oxidoreductase [Anaerolineaceae bacterium]|nr:NAD(P)/FAD-dependent oxidoreductase [Anaerolineaceae bacterium]
MQNIIIGAGAAGLTCAAALAKAGHSVKVFDPNPKPGGVLQGLQKDGYTWDLGQLLVEGFGQGEPTGNVLEALGCSDDISLIKDDRRYVFPDFSIDKPKQYIGPKWRIDFLKNKFSEDASGLERYWKDYLRFTRLMTSARSMGETSGLPLLIKRMQLLATMLPFASRKDWNAEQVMSDYFKSPELQAIFISILADFFTPPSQFQGLGVFALNPEPSFDARIPKQIARGADQLYYYSIIGGTTTVVNALVRVIKENGGELHLNESVTGIDVVDNKVIAVRTSTGTTYPADVIVASGGAKEIFFDLVGEQNLSTEFSQQVQDLPLMDSIFMVHLGLDYDPSPTTGGVCTYYYRTYDIEGSIKESKTGVYHQGNYGFVIHQPSLRTPGMAPEGHHVMTIYTICPDQLSEGDWDSQKEAFTEQLLAYAEESIPDLHKHITTTVSLTPKDFQKITHTRHHAFGGLAPIMGKSGIPHQTPIEGLWFVGHQSEGGGGLAAVIPQAYQTAKRIVEILSN